MRLLAALSLLLGLASPVATARAEDPKPGETKIVLIAGRPSHGPGEHEFNAGIKLLAKCLGEVKGIRPVVVTGGWPDDDGVLEGAKSVVFFMDGGNGHPMITGPHMATMTQLMQQDVGLVCLHYAVEFPKGYVGNQLLDWLGGYYETGYSDNPHNDAEIVVKEGHPITRGVRPFRANDEWYFKIRFKENDARVTTILTAKELVGHDKQTYRDQIVAWATERKGGGRAFGFTGAHFHKNWGNPDFRKLVLNAILWSAHVEVPSEGIPCQVSEEELKQNLDPKGK